VRAEADQHALEEVWRSEAPHVLGALVRRYGDLGDCEDAVQEALVVASRDWARTGSPSYPRGWLIRTASRRLLDMRRSESARSDREHRYAGEPPSGAASTRDDPLDLLTLCCHPVLTPASQVALTLRAVGGLTTAQVAAAFGVPERTMAQRVTRAKATLRSSGVRLRNLAPDELPDRLAAVLRVLYLVFTEGHTTTEGDDLIDSRLSTEAIRLVRDLHSRLPDHDETAGLLALMLLTDARRASRTDEHGDLVPLEHQDRARWDHDAIAEGVAIVERVLPRGFVGTYQLQAAIAAVHAEAPTWDDTDWPQVTALYRMLDEYAPGRAVTLNLAAAVGMSEGAHAGLAALRPVLDDATARGQHRTHAVHAHLLERAGDLDAARVAYATAARLATNAREQRYLNHRLVSLGGG
jgi:RNA polymerase sigma factor (sigma-70 family)